MNHALDTCDWDVALSKVAALSSGEAPIARSVGDCVEAWKRQIEVEPSTRRKYERLLDQFAAWCAGAGIRRLGELSVERVSGFRAARSIARSTSVRELHTLRQFFSFCQARGWIRENPAKAIKPPKGKPRQVMPFTQDEMIRILDACDRIGFKPYERLRAKALILVMRHTGLAIGDAVFLRRDAIQPDGYLLAHRQKTEKPVRLRVPDEVLATLAALPLPRMHPQCVNDDSACVVDASEVRYFTSDSHGAVRSSSDPTGLVRNLPNNRLDRGRADTVLRPSDGASRRSPNQDDLRCGSAPQTEGSIIAEGNSDAARGPVFLLRETLRGGGIPGKQATSFANSVGSREPLRVLAEQQGSELRGGLPSMQRNQGSYGIRFSGKGNNLCPGEEKRKRLPRLPVSVAEGCLSPSEHGSNSAHTVAGKSHGTSEHSLEENPHSSFFFWNEVISWRALVGTAERIMGSIKRLSAVKDFHAHRFRHTLACSMLAHGATLEEVAHVLGNTPAVVYRHYQAWVPARQKRVDELMGRVNADDKAISQRVQ